MFTLTAFALLIKPPFTVGMRQESYRHIMFFAIRGDYHFIPP